MQLTSLHLDLATYGVNKDKYEGKAHFANQYGGVEIVLSANVSGEILRLCADAIVQNAREVAQNLTAATLMEAPANLLESE